MLPSTKTGASILIVEDDRDLCGLYSDFLKGEGFHVILAHSVAQGRPLLREASLAVIDVMLPDGSGLELLRLARSFALDLDAVMLTGGHSADIAVEALRLGAVDYLRKPVDQSTFLRVIRRTWEQRRAREDLARLTARLEEQRRVASLGRLAAGAAHEINNPVTALISNLGAAEAELTRLVHLLAGGMEASDSPPMSESASVMGSGEPLADAEVPASEAPGRAAGALRSVRELQGIVAECMGDARRIAEIVRGMRRLAPGADSSMWLIPEAPARNEVSPSSALREAERIVRQRWGPDAAVRWRCEVPPSVLCSGEESDLAECVADLVGNGLRAIQFVEDGSVCCSSTMEGEQVVFLVEDNGSGIGTEDLPHIFDPFYTLDRPGDGPGLGLAVVRERIRRMGGSVEVSTLPGLGTEARVVLPLALIAEVPAVEQSGSQPS